MSTGRYVKRASKCSIPGIVFSIAVETLDRERAETRPFVESEWKRATVHYTCRRRGKWSPVESVTIDTPELMHEYLHQRAHPKRINWVVCERAADVLTLSKWWDYVSSKGAITGSLSKGRDCEPGANQSDGRVRIYSLVCGYSCDIIDYSDRAKRYRWISARNYWPDGRSGEVVEGVLQRVHGADGAGHGIGEQSVVYGGTRCTLGRFIALAEWWGRNAKAPFGRTAGQLAWGYLRSHMRARAMSTHSNEDAHRLERAASHGGRASVFFSGRVGGEVSDREADHGARDSVPGRRTPGPLYQLDVSSMYPTLLRDRAFPTRLRGVGMLKTNDDVANALRYWGVIARVRIRTPIGEYPLRRGERTIYPTGEFVTTLAGPDLEVLSNEDCIVNVYESFVYEMGEPFRDCMSALLEMRKEAMLLGDNDGQKFAKLLANSVAGKLAQRSGKWVRSEKDDEDGAWGEWTRISLKTGLSHRMRHLAGLAWVWDDTEEYRGPHTSAFAYLTSYGRQMMRVIRSACPEKTVVSQDTDGVWVLSSAISRLVSLGILGDAAPGRLRIAGNADSGIWYGPRHYEVDGRWTLSGLSEPVVDPVSLQVRYAHRPPLFAALPFAAPSRVLTHYHTTNLPRPQECGRLRPDGWIDPPHILPRKDQEE